MAEPNGAPSPDEVDKDNKDEEIKAKGEKTEESSENSYRANLPKAIFVVSHVGVSRDLSFPLGRRGQVYARSQQFLGRSSIETFR